MSSQHPPGRPEPARVRRCSVGGNDRGCGCLRIAPWLVVGLALAACTSQQMYSAAQTWQRQECYKINDTQDRNRCLASTSTSYDDYKREVEAARKSN